MKNFLMKISVNAWTLENFSHIFSWISGKLPPRKFPPIKLPSDKSPIENSHLEYSHSCFQIMPPDVCIFCFFFSLFLSLSLMLLKDCFIILCFKSAGVFTFVKICQNEVLREERQLMKFLGIFQVRIFHVAIF